MQRSRVWAGLASGCAVLALSACEATPAPDAADDAPSAAQHSPSPAAAPEDTAQAAPMPAVNPDQTPTGPAGPRRASPEMEYGPALKAFFGGTVPAGFSSTHPDRLGWDGLSGYYMASDDPDALVQVSVTRAEDTRTYTLDHFSMGMPWESEGTMTGSGTQFVFENRDSPMEYGELGGYYTDVQVARPTSHHTTPEGMQFWGVDAILGLVMFEGTWDVDALYFADQRYGGATVARGRMQVGETTFEDVAFTYFEGH